MQIKNHRLLTAEGRPVAYRRTPNVSRGVAIAPKFLVLHYTAGASAEGAVAWLTNPDARASAHLVIARDGAVTQLAPFNRRTWHAGRSRWFAYGGLNDHAIGVELDNEGPLDGGPGAWSAFGRPVPDEEVIVAAHANGGPERGWRRYPAAQLAAARTAARALVARYGLIDVVGHDDIAPGRKTDPGPAFPMARFRGQVMGRAQAEDLDLVTTAAVNIRRGPGVGHRALPASPLPAGTRLALLRREGDWVKAFAGAAAGALNDLEGWVHWRYLAPVGEAGLPG